MPSILPSKTIWIWPLPATIFRSQVPTFCAPRQAGFFAESIQAWFKELLAAVSVGLAQALQAPVPEAQPVVLAERVRVRLD
jgi:hypothetical protein